MIEQMIQMVRNGEWAVFAVMFLTLLNAWLSKDSKFPFTPPTWLRPLLVIVAGQGLAVAVAAAAHVAVLAVAIHAALAAVISIGTSHAIFGTDIPGWMQSLAGIALVIEDAEPVAKKPPPPAGFARVILLVALAFGGTALLGAATPASDVSGCTKEQLAQDIQDLKPAANCVLHAVEAGSNPVQVLGECVGTTIDGVIAIVEQYLTGDVHDSGALMAKHDVFRTFLAQAKAHKAAAVKP